MCRHICDFVHRHVVFNYAHANPTRTAYQVMHEKRGVCRDYAHLALTFCRCMNIPARYCTGYLGDIGLPPPYAAMDFAGWFEVYLEGGWFTFDARNNTPRIGRVLIARGRDAADVAITTSFGLTNLQTFRVWTDEVSRWPRHHTKCGQNRELVRLYHRIELESRSGRSVKTGAPRSSRLSSEAHEHKHRERACSRRLAK